MGRLFTASTRHNSSCSDVKINLKESLQEQKLHSKYDTKQVLVTLCMKLEIKAFYWNIDAKLQHFLLKLCSQNLIKPGIGSSFCIDLLSSQYDWHIGYIQ